jgi:hypothetical protein
MSQDQLACLAPALAAAARPRALLSGVHAGGGNGGGIDGGEYEACLSLGADESREDDEKDIHVFVAHVCVHCAYVDTCLCVCECAVCLWVIARG